MQSGVSMSQDGTRAYVANGSSNNVSVIDIATNTVVATVNVGSQPQYATVTPDGTKVYVPNFGFGGGTTISVIDTATNTVAATITGWR